MSELSVLLFLAIVYAYFGYFLLVALLAAFAGKKVKKRDIEPSVALMIAAYNEEKDIKAKLDNCLALDYPKDKLEIIVVSDASTDNTDDIVRSYEDKGVRLVRVEGRVGKTEARNLAIKNTQAEIVLFSDATTEYRPDLVKKLARNFADPQVGMATAHLRYRSKDGSQMGLGQKLYWRYESFIKKSQTSLGTLTGSVGCASAFRAKAYTRLPPHIIEDFAQPLMFVLKGYRVVFEEEAVCYEYATERSNQEWSMRVRVVRGGLAALFYAKSLLNPFKHPVAAFQLVSHKLLRWLVPVLAIALFVSTLAGALQKPDAEIVGLLAGQVLFYSLVALAHLFEGSKAAAKFLGVPHYLFVVNAAALAALYKTLTAPLEPSWETERGV